MAPTVCSGYLLAPNSTIGRRLRSSKNPGTILGFLPVNVACKLVAENKKPGTRPGFVGAEAGIYSLPSGSGIPNSLPPGRNPPPGKSGLLRPC